MPDWQDLLDEIKEAGSQFDIIRRKYLKQLHELTGRNVIVYYSGWLQKPQFPFDFSINDNDKIGLARASSYADVIQQSLRACIREDNADAEADKYFLEAELLLKKWGLDFPARALKKHTRYTPIEHCFCFEEESRG